MTNPQLAEALTWAHRAIAERSCYVPDSGYANVARALLAMNARCIAAEAICEAAIRYSADWSAEDILSSGDLFNAALKAWRSERGEK